jgi:hypothetical protein
MTTPIELYDWILNKNRVRGSVKGDNGFWICGANNEGDMINYSPENEQPISFDTKTRILIIKDGTKYIIHKNTMCKALGLNKQSEYVLTTLSK